MKKEMGWVKLETDIKKGEKVIQVQSLNDYKSYFWGLYNIGTARLIVLTDKGIYEQVPTNQKVEEK